MESVQDFLTSTNMNGYFETAILCVISMISLILLISIVFYQRAAKVREEEKETKEGLYVNYHFTRLCNYKCGFCFHTCMLQTILL